jgi:hypothetical protein
MDAEKLMKKFTEKCPFAVLTQIATRAIVADEFDSIFKEHRSQQYEDTLMFSAMANAVSDVVLRFADNFHQAYKTHKEELSVSLTSFYNKINATELQISEAIVSRSAERVAGLQDQLGFVPSQPLEGYNVYALDGNHLQESEKRLKPLRLLHDAPLAGTTVGRFNLQRHIFDRAYLLEDAHAQESSTLDRVVDDLNPGDVILADRHFCILSFLYETDEKGAFFVLRQHGRFKGSPIGKRQKIGRTETGIVYEQLIEPKSSSDDFRMRRISVELDEPTRDGDTVIHLLTNLPANVSASKVADLYRHRWEEETGYYYMTTTMTCELKSVCQPKAALFLFCMAMVAFNTRQVVFAALYAEHDEDDVNNVSHHAVSVEIKRYTDGMLIVIDDESWQRVVGQNIACSAETLRECSRRIDLKQYRKSKRGPKKKVVKPPRKRPKTHVSTAKILREASKQRP